MVGGFLEFLVFDQLANQIPARIVFFGVFFRRLLIDRKQTAALQVNQVRRHDDEFARDVDVQFLKGLEIFEVLAGDSLERDLVDVELVALDQIQQKIERTLENLELDLVFALHAAGGMLGARPPIVNRLSESGRGARSQLLCDEPRRYSPPQGRT